MTDTGYAPDRWEFDGEVTRVFDNMLARSIPNFEAMRDLTSTIAARHLQPGTTVVDLGTSRGGALAALHPEAQPTVTFVGAEISLPMVEAARERFDGLANVGIAELDLRLPEHRKVLLPPSSCSVVLAVLTVQFIPIEYRTTILNDVSRALLPGGALLLVEKVLAETAHMHDVLVETYHAAKIEAGYSAEEVSRKALALEGVLVPQTASANESMLMRAGLQPECYWRWLNFAGWVGVKPS